ncbi:sodium-dependent multivitamin transporter [Aplysia californica]|uniref:Sodium-dependent multivitamin transporter n=1 Tax=Aplysia californica TaxID=6500 RepID=A0ABM1AES5_APLCA|nr:sodium-dependent multivitamin transporter [Aplysia californica]
MKKPINEFKSTILSKGLVIGYGLLAIALAWIVSNLGSVLQAVYIVFGILNGPLLGVFTLGMFFPWANKHGALGGVLVSLTFLLWIGIAAFVNELKTPASPTSIAGCNFTAKPIPSTTPKPPPKEVDDPFEDLYRMSYMYYTALGMILVWGIGLPISFITGYTRPRDLDPRLICPLAEKLVPCLPQKVKNFFRCGLVHEGKYDKGEDFALSGKELSADPGVQTEKNGFPPSDHADGVTNGYSVSDQRPDGENPAFEPDDSKYVTHF